LKKLSLKKLKIFKESFKLYVNQMRSSSPLAMIALTVSGLAPTYDSDGWLCYNDYVFELEANCASYAETAFDIDTDISGYMTIVMSMCGASPVCSGFSVYPDDKSMVKWNHNWLDARKDVEIKDAITCFDTNFVDPDVSESCTNSHGQPWTVFPTLSPTTLIPTPPPVESSSGSRLSQTALICVIITCVLVGIIVLYCVIRICCNWRLRANFGDPSKYNIFV